MIIINNLQQGFTTLSSSTIESIRQRIAFETGRFDFDISDEEVFAEVEEQLMELDEKHINRAIANGTDYEPVEFSEAAEYCMDDWGVYDMGIATTRYAQKGNTFLTFPTI